MNSRRYQIAALVSILLGTGPAAPGQNAIPGAPQSRPVALTNATIHTVSGPVLHDATLLFDKGKIVAVGTDVQIPDGADRVDARGKHVYPGLIDAYNTVGLSEIGLGAPGTVDLSETGNINPSARAEVAFHPESELIPVARSGGVAVANVAPTGGLISGTSAAMQLEGWTWEEMTLRSGTGLIVDWPQMLYAPGRFSRQTKDEWTKHRDAQLASLAETIRKAKAYRMARAAAASGGSRQESDANLDALQPVIDGTVPLIVNAPHLAEIQAAVAFAGEHGLRLIIAGGADAPLIAPVLREKNIPVIVTDVQNAGRRWEPYDQTFTLAARLAAAGVAYCITGDRAGSNLRNLSHHAAHASAYGLSREEALRAITLYPARILGIDDRVGSIAPGMDATLLIADGDILEITSRVEQVYVQGRRADMRDKHVRLYEKYQERYRQLRTGKR